MATNTNRQRGKRHQKVISDKIDGMNIGILGGIDVLTDKFSIECKSRVTFVARKWMEQAIKNCKKGTLPIVIVHEKNKRYDNDMVIVRLNDFLKIIGESDVLTSM